jgi:hypothetical protein
LELILVEGLKISAVLIRRLGGVSVDEISLKLSHHEFHGTSGEEESPTADRITIHPTNLLFPLASRRPRQRLPYCHSSLIWNNLTVEESLNLCQYHVYCFGEKRDPIVQLTKECTSRHTVEATTTTIMDAFLSRERAPLQNVERDC